MDAPDVFDHTGTHNGGDADLFFGRVSSPPHWRLFGEFDTLDSYTVERATQASLQMGTSCRGWSALHVNTVKRETVAFLQVGSACLGDFVCVYPVKTRLEL